MRLRNKLLAAYLGLSIILFFCGGLGVLYLIERGVRVGIENDLRNGTHAIINLVENTAQSAITNYLRAVAESNLDIAHSVYRRHRQGDLTDREARSEIRGIFLSQIIGKTGYIYCLDSRGVAVVHPNEGVEGNNWSHFEFVRKQTQLKSGYIEYQWQNPGETKARSKALYMVYFEPYDWIISVSSYRSEFNELLPMAEIRQSVLNLKYGSSGYVFIADRQGNVIIHPEIEGQNLFDVAKGGAGFFKKMVAEEFGQVTYMWQNPGESRPREKLAMYGHIPEFQWIVGSSGYVDEIYAPIQNARNLAIVFIGIAVLLSVILTLFVSDSITRRLRHLMEVITKGDQGDLTVRVDPGTNDEIGRLGHIFNAFLERLQSYHRQLAAEIDKHRATATSLQKIRDFNEMVLSTVEALVIVLDRDGRVVSFNRACEKCSGYSFEEVKGRSVYSFLIPEDQRGSVREGIKNLIWRQRGTHHVSKWTTKTGELRLVQWSITPSMGPDGKIEFFVSAGLDITEQKATEKALLQSEVQFEAVFNQTFQFMGILTPDGTTRSINQTALDFAGAKEEALVGRKFWETPYWSHSEAVQLKVKHAVNGASQGEFQRIQVSNAGVGDKEIFVDFSLKPVWDDAGRILMLIAEGRDISEQKQMEAQLLQSQKMDAVGTLAGGIAHDFNNSLQAISGYTQLLLMGNSGSEKQKGMLNTIQHACNHASELTRQLLTFSRKIDSQLAPIDLNTELNNVLKIVKRTLPRMIDIETHLTDDLRVVEADHTQFEQIVMNLSINAGHAMPDGGVLTIETRNVDLDKIYCSTHLGAVPGAYAMLSITDTGYGMDAETREHIFEPFFTTRETGSGTGLGLSMVYGIVKTHQGYITCYSEPGQGTTFKVYFPDAAKNAQLAGVSEDRSEAIGGNEFILIVDDDQAVRELGRHLLERYGYKVAESESGEAALDRLREPGVNPDLVILDLNMPGMGGIRCLEEMDARKIDVPVLIASGHAPTDQIKTTIQNLAQGFVGKPYTLDEMLKAVRKTLDRKNS